MATQTMGIQVDVQDIAHEVLAMPYLHLGQNRQLVREFIRRLHEQAGLPQEDPAAAGPRSYLQIAYRRLEASSYKPLERFRDDMKLYGGWLLSKKLDEARKH